MKVYIWVIAASLAASCGDARAAGGQFDLAACSGCHALTKPSDTSFERLWTRKAPDLWYAGDKFNRDWLVAWLQDPKPIHPAGYPYFKTVKEGTEHDEPDPTKITPHVKLSKPDAEAAATALLALKGPADLVPAGAYKGDPGGRMGALAFIKLRGCQACHQGEGGQGGLSGPEMTDAGARLRPDFIAAYTADPQRFDPHVWMPKLKLNDQDIQRLTGYLTALGAGDKK
jgi:mono/diheme cytochrome c family protein